MYKLLCRIESGDGTSRDLDLLLEIAGSMGIMSGTTICGLADGNNWAIRTIVNKYRDEFEARLRPALVPVTMSVSSSKMVGQAVPSPITWYLRPMSKSISASNWSGPRIPMETPPAIAPLNSLPPRMPPQNSLTSLLSGMPRSTS